MRLRFGSCLVHPVCRLLGSKEYIFIIFFIFFCIVNISHTNRFSPLFFCLSPFHQTKRNSCACIVGNVLVCYDTLLLPIFLSISISTFVFSPSGCEFLRNFCRKLYFHASVLVFLVPVLSISESLALSFPLLKMAYWIQTRCLLFMYILIVFKFPDLENSSCRSNFVAIFMLTRSFRRCLCYVQDYSSVWNDRCAWNLLLASPKLWIVREYLWYSLYRWWEWAEIGCWRSLLHFNCMYHREKKCTSFSRLICLLLRWGVWVMRFLCVPKSLVYLFMFYAKLILGFPFWCVYFLRGKEYEEPEIAFQFKRCRPNREMERYSIIVREEPLVACLSLFHPSVFSRSNIRSRRRELLPMSHALKRGNSSCIDTFDVCILSLSSPIPFLYTFMAPYPGIVGDYCWSISLCSFFVLYPATMEERMLIFASDEREAVTRIFLRRFLHVWTFFLLGKDMNGTDANIIRAPGKDFSLENESFLVTEMAALDALPLIALDEAISRCLLSSCMLLFFPICLFWTD